MFHGGRAAPRERLPIRGSALSGALLQRYIVILLGRCQENPQSLKHQSRLALVSEPAVDILNRFIRYRGNQWPRFRLCVSYQSSESM